MQEFAIAMDVSPEAGSAWARILPWDSPIPYGGERVSFARGSVEIPEGVSVSVDHGRGVMDTIGVLSEYEDRADGLYGLLTFADTILAQEVRSLLSLGAVTDVSAGVDILSANRGRDGITRQTGRLDHVAVVREGAFGNAGAGSKVLAVHSREGSMENVEAPAVEQTENAPTLEPVSMAEYTREVAELRKTVAEMAVPGTVDEDSRQEFSSLRDFMLTQLDAARGDRDAQRKIADHAERMRQEFVLADDTTTSAAGLVPDHYSSKIIGLIDNMRPGLDPFQRDDIGTHGMTVKYPRRLQKPAVGVQSAEKTEVASQATTFDFLDVPLATYSGASDVSMQLVTRSAPSFLTRLYEELAGVYAEQTGDAFADALIAAASAGAVIADLSADAAATWAGISGAAGTVAINTKRPATHLIVSVDKWAEILALAETTGRPMLNVPGSPGGEDQGNASFSSFSFSYGGLIGVVDIHAPAGTVVVAWDGAAAYLEQEKQEMRAIQVDLLGWDIGVYGLFAPVVKYPGGLVKITEL